MTMQLLREPLRWEFKGNETQFEGHIIEHINELNDILGLPLITTIGRQKQIRASGFQVIIDIITRHEDDTATIYEVKKANNKHPSTGTFNQMQGIGQLLLYQNMFELKTGVRPRLVLVDNKIYERTLWAFANNNLPITLLEMQKDRVFIPYKAF